MRFFTLVVGNLNATWTQSEPPRGSGWVQAQRASCNLSPLASHPPATAGGTDCVQARLFISQRNEWVDFRGSACRDVAGDQCHEGQQRCQGAIRQDVCWSNTEQ